MAQREYLPGATYEYKAYAIRGTQIEYGNLATFAVPLVTTGNATAIGQSQARLGVNVTGLRSGDECGVCWGPTGSSLDFVTQLGPERVRCMRQIPCLNAAYFTSDGYMAQSEYSPGATYDYRGYVINDAGVAYGSTQSFSVPQEPDSVVSKKLCFYLRTTYTDSNHGEDLWTASTSDVPAAGFYWQLTQSDGPGYIDGYTDSTGCSTVRSMQTGSRSVGLQSSGYPTGDRSAETVTTNGWLGHANRNVVISNSTSNQYVFITPPDNEDGLALNVHAVFALSLFTIPGSITEGYLQAALTTGATNYDWSAKVVRINKDLDARKKFIIAHETGHMVLRRSVATLPNNDFTFNDAGNTVCAYLSPGGGAGHNFTSQEYQGSSLHEGFANFYSAAIFNSASVNANCMLTAGGMDGVDCDTGTTHNMSLRLMERWCDAPFAGKGVETDWLRTFWNVYTGVDASSIMVSASAIIAWIGQASSIGTSWTPNGDNAYQLLDAAADQIQGPLDANWDVAKIANGINH
jgi:hypothetical protein